MKRNIILVCATAVLISILAGCSKNAAIPNFNTITVSFANTGPKFVTSDLTVNPKDSIQFNYTVDCPTGMKYVFLQKNGNIIAADTFKIGNVLHFSTIKKFIADSAAGPFTYKVIARDSGGVYLGASSGFTITTTPDFNYYINRTLFVPDTLSKSSQSFINLATGTTYSYNDVSTGSLSGQVDLGYFFSTDTINTSGTSTVNKVAVGHTLYAPSSTPVGTQRTFYDISAWTKNATQLKVAGTPSFASLLSGGGLKSAGLTNLKTPAYSVPEYTPGLAQNVNKSFAAITSGTVIFFKTVAGKYGAIQVDYINQNTAAKGTFMTIDIKIQK